ncbi:MAG: hypothetical protein A3E82_01735 [Gammaproteobacteria bacterium RIFCSPHIGHO2_12_FULL_38_11]|nr:MAG: hypothetical protein A3E82_01735 [Gammaproteobacteria bacterium RIFCSPHIGHO2_12_FULL_38_11]
MKQELANAIKHWDYIAPLVKYPKNKKEFDELVLELDELLIIVGNNEKNHLMGLVDILSNIISAYEKEHFPVNTKGIDALKYLMEAHNLHQADLSEIGSQGVISEILRGKRDLNLRQIKLLAKRFNLNPITFID